jgi:Aldose 1-epimerase
MTAQSDLLTIVTSPVTPDSPQLQHLLMRPDHHTPTDPELIPTGAIVSVTATPFDFRRLRPIGDVDIS